MGPPMSRLPIELLQQVFEELSKSHLLELRHALLTCKLWFGTITSFKRVWATIEVNKPFADHLSSRSSAEQVAFLKSCVARSGRFPLRLHLSISDLFKIWGEHDPYMRLPESVNRMDNIFSALRDGGTKTLDRYQSLEIVCDNVDPHKALECVKDFTVHLTNLRRLTFREFGPTHRDHQFTRAWRHLEEIHLEECFFKKSDAITAFTISGCQSVKKLIVERDFEWHLSIPCLYAFRGVQYLGFNSARPKRMRDVDCNGSGEPRGSISLPSVQTLELVGIVPFFALGQLRLPKLAELRIGCDESGYHSMSVVLQTDFGNQIKSLVISTDSDDLRVHLPKFLERASNLRSLTLPRQWKDNPDARIELSKPLDLVFV